MKIVLCDDERKELDQLADLTRKCLEKCGEREHQLLSYEHSNELDFDLEDRARADLYILDIDMPEPNGITLAKKIQRVQPLAFVFFYTSHIEFATAGYQVEARRYLLKGGDPDLFLEAIEYACREIKQKLNDCISLPFYHDTTIVPVGDIVYAERSQRQVFVFTHSHGTIQTSQSINGLFKQLDRPQFVFIDRGTFINIEYVSRTDQNTVCLFDGKVFYISQKRIRNVKDAVASYWRVK